MVVIDRGLKFFVIVNIFLQMDESTITRVNCIIMSLFIYIFSEKTRARFINLVSQAYSSISLIEFSNYVGLSELEAGELASQQPGWSIDTQNKIIIPTQVKEVKETETIPSEQQLQLLTDFVAFLEK